MKTLKSITTLILVLLFSTTIYANDVTTKRITKITVQGEEYTYNYTLSYDAQGRITKVVPDNSEIFGITKCEYTKKTFRIYKNDIFVSCSLNKHGYIINSKDGDFPIMLIGDIYYNEKGQLLSIRNGDEKMLFKWENGDMVKINFENEQINVSYTSLENKNQFGLFLKIEEENCTPVFPYYSLLGKATRHLPASIGQGEEKISYNYKTLPSDKNRF